MVRNLFHTLGSRLIISLFNLVLLFITTKWMGAENKGEISLLVLNLSVAAILSGLFGGPSLVYLLPRFPLRRLFILNYGWSIVTSGLIVMIALVGILPSSLSAWELFFLALMECLVAANTMMLLGNERVRDHNLTQVIKVFVTVLVLLIQKGLGNSLDFVAFVESYQIGLAGALLFSILQMRAVRTSISETKSWMETLASALTFGGLVQLGNGAQLLNFRLSFYFLELLIHPIETALIRIGIYSAALQVAEAVWQFARSVSTVQYAKVSNLNDPKEGLRISLLLTKLNLLVTTLGVFVLALLPQAFYTHAFGAEFGEIKRHVIVLAPGIIALSMSNAFSHFFAGVGLHRFNTFSSLTGLVITASFGYIAIQSFGTIGAALTASVVYVVQTAYQYFILVRDHGVRIGDIVPMRKDVRQLLETIRGSRP